MAIKLDFKQSTWDKAKPKDLKKDKLSAALKDVEKTSGDEKKLAACIAAMRQAVSAAEDLMGGECNAKKDKELNAALKKLVGDGQAEIKKLQEALEAAQSSDEEDDDDGSIEKLLNKAKFPIFLKKAKGADTGADGPGCCFCFHMKDAEKCELVFDMPAKIQSRYAKLKARLPKIDSDFKKRNIVKGFAYRDQKFLVIECEAGEEPPQVPGMDKKLRNWAKTHKKDISPMKKIRMSVPGMAPIVIDVPEDDEIESLGAETEEQATTATPPKAPPVPPTAGATATAGVPPQAPPAPNGAAVDAAAMEDRRKEFRQARQAWQTAKEKAIQDLEMVKDRIRDYYLDDPELFKVATSKLKQLDGIMDNLGDELRDILDKYVSTPKAKQDVLQQLASEAKATVDRFLKYVASDALLNAVDSEQEMGIADIKVREPLQNALKRLVSSLG